MPADLVPDTVNSPIADGDPAKSSIRKAPLDKCSESRVGRDAIEEIMAGNTGHSLEVFDDLPESIQNLRDFFRVFNIVCDIRYHQPAMLDLDDNLSAFRHADA